MLTIFFNINQDESCTMVSFPVPILADCCEGQLGPLAGLLTGLEWARETLPGCEWLVSAPVDTPFLPHDVQHLIESQTSTGASSEIAVALSAGRRHPGVRFGRLLRRILAVCIISGRFAENGELAGSLACL